MISSLLRAPRPSSLPEPQKDMFRILVLSDLHIPAHPEATRLIASNGALWRSVDFVVLLGDMVSSYGTPNEYEHITKFLKQWNVPYAAIPGNHEFYFETPEQVGNWGKGSLWNEAAPEVKSDKLQQFAQFYGIENLWRAQHTPLGSFLFLALDDVEQSKPETISQAQRDWLQHQLKVQPDKPCFIFCHAPAMFERRLDMIYYDETRSACVEFSRGEWPAFHERSAPVFWFSGHIHLRPDHYLFPAYLASHNAWQVHCPDSWGYSRWHREQHTPQRHTEIYSRIAEISSHELSLVVHHHNRRENIARQTIQW
jgi:hypothetical protein